MKNQETEIKYRRKPIYAFFKRLADIICSFIGILFFILPFIIVAIAIKVDSRGPVLFKQDRVGRNKKIFKILKFRSMRVDTDPNAPTHELQNADSHITKVGRILRKTSLDELPQLFNIFVGHMSIVGPRPALWNQYDLIEERDKYFANRVRPGLTGLAQIMGRDQLEIPIKAKYDGEYVRKREFFYDISLIFRTFTYVLKHEGVVEGGTGAMKKQEEENKK